MACNIIIYTEVRLEWCRKYIYSCSYSPVQQLVLEYPQFI
jgi:hypothetical protein